MPVNRSVIEEALLILSAAFAVAWAVARACVQSITIDEADTYLLFGSRELNWVWWPDSNNHVLNSALMWLVTHAFGASAFTVRTPALAGAVFYIFICYLLCRMITKQFSLRLPLFICLTFNPFIFDYLVAARGYSLALAFLLAAIAIPLWHSVEGGPSLRKSCVLASLALALSFSANFSFAFADGVTLLGLIVYAVRRRDDESAARILEFCVLPGLLVTLLLCGYPLAHWKAGALWYGAKSLSEMAQSLVKPSLFQLDPGLRGSGLYLLMNFMGPLLLPLLGVLSVCQIVVTRLDGTWLEDARIRKAGRFAAGLVGIAAFSVLLHWLAFHFVGLPLPRARTGIYLVPLLTLAAGIIAAARPRCAVSGWLRRGLTAVFLCLAFYFVMCLRLTYFEEWKWDSDAKDVYAVLAHYNHGYHVNDVGMTWWYVSCLNFYRTISQAESFPEFRAPAKEPEVHESIYVLHGLFDRAFLDREKLVVVYRGKSTDVVVAVRRDGPIPPIRIDP